MKAKELRLGNLLDNKGVTVHVMEIKSDGIECGYFSDSIGFYRRFNQSTCPNPIPLTEEWLERFSFNTESGEYWTIDQGEDLLSIEIERHRALIGRVYEWEAVAKKIEYVHQLQNLYFALTGEELELKEIEKA